MKKILYDYKGCFDYGIMWGCDSKCPVLNAGKCELYANVKKFNKGKQRKERIKIAREVSP